MGGVGARYSLPEAAVAPILFPEMQKRGSHPGELSSLLATSSAPGAPDRSPSDPRRSRDPTTPSPSTSAADAGRTDPDTNPLAPRLTLLVGPICPEGVGLRRTGVEQLFGVL